MARSHVDRDVDQELLVATDTETGGGRGRLQPLHGPRARARRLRVCTRLAWLVDARLVAVCALALARGGPAQATPVHVDPSGTTIGAGRRIAGPGGRCHRQRCQRGTKGGSPVIHGQREGATMTVTDTSGRATANGKLADISIRTNELDWVHF